VEEDDVLLVARHDASGVQRRTSSRCCNAPDEPWHLQSAAHAFPLWR
jgi:hypothetical protein